MKTFIAKITNLILLVASVAWLAQTFRWDALFAAVGCFGAAVGFAVADFVKGRKLCDQDKQLYEKFIGILPHDSNGIRFLHEHDIGASFRSKNLDAFEEFLNKWNNASHEFINSNLNNLLSIFRTKLRLFLKELYENVDDANMNGFLKMDINDFETRPEIFAKRDELNDMASDVYEAYQSLIRAAKQKL